jgi:hypothetical protein
MHWFWILSITIEVLAILWVTSIERNAILHRINGANGFMLLMVLLMCAGGSIIVTIGSWILMDGMYALKVAGIATLLLLVLGYGSIHYLDALGKKIANQS